MQLPKPTAVDKLIGFFSPRAAMGRIQARTAWNVYNQFGTGYNIPGSNNRTMKAWRPSNGNADQNSIPFLELMRAGSRDSYMNSPIGTGALRRMRTNVVGYGLQLQARIDRDYLGLSDDAADRWEVDVEREWKLWAGSTCCDITRTQNFYGMQALAFLSTMMNGDAFAILRSKREIGSVYDLRVMLVEADQVSNPVGRMDDNVIAGGIEVDGDGKPIAYHVKKSRYIDIYTAEDWAKIPAFGAQTGRRNVLHLLDRERIGQRRGIPLLAPVLSQLKQITRLSDAELMAAVIASFFTVFVKTSTGSASGLMDGFIPEEAALSPSGDGTTGRTATSKDNNQYEIGSGNIIELGDDQDITIADSKRPSAAYAGFFEAIAKEIGASIEVPYEVLMLHFTASYSASRAAILEAWKTFKRHRFWLIENFCQPIYEDWLAEAVLKGRIDAPGYLDDPAIRSAWAGAYWAGMGQGQIDPLKETKAAIMRINGNLSTFEDEYLKIDGGDWDAAMRRKGRENRLLTAAGLSTIVSDGSAGSMTIEQGATE